MATSVLGLAGSVLLRAGVVGEDRTRQRPDRSWSLLIIVMSSRCARGGSSAKQKGSCIGSPSR